MSSENDKQKKQDENLEELNYPATEDIFNKQDHISLDADGADINALGSTENLDMDLDVPGSDLDNQQEKIGSEDEENNYYSQSDNNDDHEEVNEDLIN